MSENLTKIGKLKYRQFIELQSTENKDLAIFNNIEVTSRSKVECVFIFTNEILCELGKIIQKTNLSNIDILNNNLPKNTPPLKENVQRVEQSLRRRISEAKYTAAKLKGRKKYEFLAKQVRFIILRGEFQDITEILQKAKKESEEKQQLEQQVLQLSIEIADLQTNINRMHVQNEQYEVTLKKFVERNSKLNSLVQSLTQKFANTGKKIGGCSRVTVRRKGKLLRSRVESALWFAKSFGVEFTPIRVVDETGREFDLLKNKSANFKDLCEDDKNKVKSLLYILDTFGISYDAYHELSLKHSSMVRSYLIKQCREDINRTIIISETPGTSRGAQLDLIETLDRLIIDNVQNGTIVQNGLSKPVVRVKFSADGAKMSRLANFLVFSLAILNCGQHVMSCNGYQTIAIVDCSENFVSLKESFKDILNSINSLLARDSNGKIPFVTSNNTEVELELFIGGDMKFLLMVCGLNAANSKHACLYCKIQKDSRGDTSKSETFYLLDNNRRTISEMKKLANKKTNNFGCIHPPLIDIDLDHIVVDELHLLMRIIDVLLRNLIEDAVNRDQREKIRGECTPKNLSNLVNIIRSCGVSFSVWEKKMKDGRGDFLKNLEWTSLTGSDMKKLLRYLPQKLSESTLPSIAEDTKEHVISLWSNFSNVYGIINNWAPSEEDIDSYFEKARSWVNDFLYLSQYLEGYDRKSVTPYMHIMLYHIPMFLRKYKSVKLFTGQGVEKVNDDIKLIYHRKTNKHNTTTDALRVRYRKYLIRKCTRIKRKYIKTNDHYWNVQKRETARLKIRTDV